MWAFFRCSKSGQKRLINISRVEHISFQHKTVTLYFNRTSVTYHYDTVDELQKVFSKVNDHLHDNSDRGVLFYEDSIKPHKSEELK
jgi:hypothetical protein